MNDATDEMRRWQQDGFGQERRKRQITGRGKANVTNEDSWASVKEESSNIYIQRGRRRGMLTNASGEEGDALVYFRRPFTPQLIVIIAAGENVRTFCRARIFQSR